MSGSASEPISVEALAEEFLERRRRGERPSVADYVLRYPHLAEEIREFFPVLGLVEDFKPVSDGVTEPMELLFVFGPVGEAGQLVGLAVEGLAADAACVGEVGNIAVVPEKDSIDAGKSLLGL